ncbi:YwqJ-related putative deaminase [Streptomyces sp. NPDC057386]|uniref:YwqJ-related putative deaminase n=2 Tax=Streptomyces TaxID=1883 RepID=A0ABV5VLJ7_9ACTN
MNATDTGPRQAPHSAPTDNPRTTPTPTPATSPADPRTGDPRIDWSTTETPHTPTLRHRRDGILPTIAAALSVRGATLTATAARGETPPTLHPLVQDFLDTLTSNQRDRFTGRCAETILISRHLTTADAARSKRAARKPMTNGEARKALKHAKLTTRRIREDGDPLHGTFTHPCRACTALSAHFGIRIVDPATDN